MDRKLRMGMVGGGLNAFIGAIHRKAAAMDGEVELVCGAFSADAERSRIAGLSLCLPAHRVYGDFVEMIEREAALPADQRMDFVAIVTPNDAHFQPARLAMRNRFHVIVEKPMTFCRNEALALRDIALSTGQVLAVMHTYSGYPMVKEARTLVAEGAIGKVRKVYVEYTQGWLAVALEDSGQKQAGWRTDPARSGAGGAIGDIGTHAAHLAEYVTGAKITSVNALLNTFVSGRRLDDDASMLLRFRNGASGTLVATQVAVGEENNLTLRIYGETGGLEWRQQEPNTLIRKWVDRPAQVLRAGSPTLSTAAHSNTRTPLGHPEGYIEAFANIYLAFGRAIRDHGAGKPIDPADYDFPGVEEGVRGMSFIDAVLASSASDHKWTPLP